MSEYKETRHQGKHATAFLVSRFQFHNLVMTRYLVCLFLAQQPPVGQGLLIHKVSRSHTTTRHSRQDFSGRVISLLQRPLPDNTQHSQQTDIHALGGIRTHSFNRRAAADLRLRPRGHWDRLVLLTRVFSMNIL